MRGRRRGAAVALGLATVLLMTACGDDKDKDSASQTATTVAPATTTTLSQAQLDKQKAQRVVLVAADVPGFTLKPPDPSEEPSAEFDKASSACVNNNALIARIGKQDDARGAAGSNFNKGETSEVSSDVTFGETEDEAKKAIADVSVATFPACFAKAFAGEIKTVPGASNVTATTTKLPALTVGDQSIGYRTVVKFRAEGAAQTLNIDCTFIRSGRGLVEVDTSSSTATPFPEAERVRLATTLAGRMVAP